MGNNNAEVTFQIRSSVDRRKVEDRRLFLEQEYLDHNPERRVNVTFHRMPGDRRELLPDIRDTFREEDLLFSHENILLFNA
jgi:hypothetical protein